MTVVHSESSYCVVVVVVDLMALLVLLVLLTMMTMIAMLMMMLILIKAMWSLMIRVFFRKGVVVSCTCVHPSLYLRLGTSCWKVCGGCWSAEGADTARYPGFLPFAPTNNIF